MLSLLALLACTNSDTPPGGDIGPTTPTADTASTLPTGPDPRIEAHGVQVCVDPSARATAPFTRKVFGEDWPKSPDYRTPGWDLRFGGRGVSVGDLNSDGHLDIFVPRQRFGSRFLFGDGTGELEDRSALSVPQEIADTYGASMADADGDRDLDVFLYRQLSAPVLLRNDGNGTFTPEPKPEWDAERSGCGGTGSFGDFDLDGDLDLFYGRLGAERGETYFECKSTLLENTGTDYVDRSAELSADVQHLRAMVSAWLPLDDDPWPELYVVADLPETLDGNRINDNDGGAFFPVTDHELHFETAGMGLAVGDLNDDGQVDLMVPGIREIITMQSSAVGWINISAASGLTPDARRDQIVGWGGEWVDLDNDGYLDLPVLFGDLYPLSTSRQPDALFHNTGTGSFESVEVAWGFDDPEVMRGYAVGDLDGNGFPDVIKREFAGVVITYLGTCDDSAWLTVRLDDPRALNPYGVGARIGVTAQGRTQYRWLLAGGSSYASSGPMEVYVGLGNAEQVDAIEVVWPDGEVVRYGGVEPRQAVTVHREPSD